MQFPKFRKVGGKLPELCRTVEEICRVLPQLDVRGDNVTTFVDEHTSGKVIRAKPKQAGGVSGGEGSSAYDGPWSFSDYYNESNIRFLRIKCGYYNRNGLIIPFNANSMWDIGYYDRSYMGLTSNPYWIYLHQTWNYNTKMWEEPEIVFRDLTYGNPLTEQPSQNVARNTVIEGFALLGAFHKEKTPQWICLNQALPVMFVTGSCLYDNVETENNE